MASTNRLSPIPHPPTKPVVGNMLSLDSTAPVQNLARLAKELGPIFWLDMMGAPLVDRLRPRPRRRTLRREALRQGGARTAAPGARGRRRRPVHRRYLEPNWSKAHNILLQPFGNRAMQSYHPSMVDIAEQLVKKWERLNADEEIDVVHDMTALTLDTIGLCGFDYRFNSFYRRDYHPFVELLVRSLETIMMIRGLPLENLWMQKRRRDLAGDVAFMNKMVDEIVAERRKNAEAAADKKDMLGAMMTGVDRATGEQLDDVNIRYQINTFLIAGHETTSGLLSCTLYALLKHPDVLKKAYEEVDRVLGPDIDARPTYQQVTQLTYITQILKEALRLWPPAPAYGISPLKDETIGGKYKLKKNTFITVLVLALHRDPSVWGPNPDAFDPENFSREAEAARPVNAWKPFGNGQRACIGRGFAMHEAALAIGMILQRFKLIDVNRYQMQLKETLTIKPDGFKIKVRPRTEKDRGAYAGRAATTAAASGAAAAPRARTRPGHNTPLLVLYGSNLGTAEELATRVADLAEVNGFATKLAPLDDFVGKLPEQGGVLIFCASYNGAPPDNATQFVKWLGGDLPKDAFAKLRYAVFGCGNSDWAATYQSIPRLIDEQLAAHGGAQRLCARRGRCPQRSRWPIRELVRQAGAAGDQGIRHRFQLQPQRRRRAALHDRAGGAVRGQCDRGARRRRADEGAGQQRIAEQDRAPTPSDRSTRHIEVQLPPASPIGSAIISAWCRATIRRWWIRWRAASDFCPPTRSGCRSPKAAARNCRSATPCRSAGCLTEFVELQQVATRKQIQIMSEHTRCPVTKPKLLAYVGDDAAATERYRADILGKRKSVFDLLEEHPACELPFHAYLEMLSLLAPRYYSISSSPSVDPARCSVTVAVVEGAREFGARHLQGHLLELSRRPPRRRDHPRHGARNQGRLPAARRFHRCRSS